jgi:hypothetical protein
MKTFPGSLFFCGLLLLVPSAIVLPGCPMSDDPAGPAPPASGPAEAGSSSPEPLADGGQVDGATIAPATHNGLASIQDIQIANLPQAGHGLTMTFLLNPAVPPDYEERPGEVSGCRAWAHDATSNPPPPEQDHGAIRVEGVKNGPYTCQFLASRGYVCPTTAPASGSLVTGAANAGAASYSVPGAAFSANDVGRYLQVSGATTAANNGAFAIVGVVSPTEVMVANPRATAESAAAVSYVVVAGAGPTPNDLFQPFVAGTKVTVDIARGGAGAFDVPPTALTPGAPFVLDATMTDRLQHVPVTGEALTLSCADCGTADGTIVRITTTDGEVAGLSPVAMPAIKRKLIEIQCLALGTGSVTVPAPAMDLLRQAHAASPITRIRTAFMRDGLAIATNAPPKAPNRIAFAVGRGVLGFSQP